MTMPDPSMPSRRTVSALLPAALALAAAAILATTAPGGVQLVDKNGNLYRWDLDAPGQPNVVDGEVTYYADTASLRDQVNGPKTAGNAIRDGVAVWEVGTTRIRFRSDTARTAVGRNGLDRVNWIGWSSGELSPLTLAATFPTRIGTTVVDMDVVLNDQSFSWDTWNPGIPGDADIEALIAHEWGHAIGCDHVPLRASTMYFSATTGQISPRSIEPDDRALVGSIYPNDAFHTTTGSIAGRVEIAGVKDDRAAHVIAVAVDTAEPAGSTLTAPDGSFEIRGLPRGTYRVLVAPTNPLGTTMNEYWRNGSTTFLPAVALENGANPGRARTFLVEEGLAADAGTLQVAASGPVLEPNESVATASLLRLGDAVCAAFESGADQDWYAFDAPAGQAVTLSVLAWEIGSDADPSLRLSDADGVTVTTVNDIRGVISATRPAGEDRDARIIGWRAPESGRWHVRIGQDKPVAGSQGFYVLFVTPASDAPSASQTTAEVTPARIDAGGQATATLTVTPRREDGLLVGTGATVQIAHSGGGTVGPVVDSGAGTYRATITSAAAPGNDVFSVVVTSGRGIATTQDAAEVVYVGPGDAARTTLVVDPRRLALDDPTDTLPPETATIRFVPRDAAGEALGAGRDVALLLEGGEDASAGPTDDRGDGAYEAVLTAATKPGTGTVRASVDAQGVVASAACAFGFALPEVLAAASADVTGFRAVTPLPQRSRLLLARAAAKLEKAAAKAGAAAQGPASERAALSGAVAALSSIRAAIVRSQGRLTDPGTVRELALAVRLAARSAVDRAEIRNGRDQNRVLRAEKLLLQGDAAAETGSWPKAASRWLNAFRTVQPLL
jgi:hypothetical protein